MSSGNSRGEEYASTHQLKSYETTQRAQKHHHDPNVARGPMLGYYIKVHDPLRIFEGDLLVPLIPHTIHLFLGVLQTVCPNTTGLIHTRSGRRVEQRKDSQGRVILIIPDFYEIYRLDYETPARDISRPMLIGIALSGGGTRATMTSVGALRRMWELGILQRATTISSVSGGGLANAVLAMNWLELMRSPLAPMAAFEKWVQEPIQLLCSTNLAFRVLGKYLNPGSRIKRRMRKIFGRKQSSSSLGPITNANMLSDQLKHAMPGFAVKLSDLPPAGHGVPRFVFCATDMRSGQPFYMTQGYAGLSYKTASIIKKGAKRPLPKNYINIAQELSKRVQLCDAVAASAAAPALFESFQIRYNNATTGKKHLLHLTDGGIFDNLGLEPLLDEPVYIEGLENDRHNVIFVNDAGLPSMGDAVARKVRWFKRNQRCMVILYEQVVESKRYRLNNSFSQKSLVGAHWSITNIGSHISDGIDPQVLRDLKFPDISELVKDEEFISRVMSFRTDLNALLPRELTFLENIGYVLAAFRIQSSCASDLAEMDHKHDYNIEFKLPYKSSMEDIHQVVKELTEQLEHSASIIKSAIKARKTRKMVKRQSKQGNKKESLDDPEGKPKT